ncbi:MAG: hypothetical protein EA397_06845 [Deltaproteobacteria bacterium]|nr:MAG: hypothetical protein EA397_06845 [Deltaproteobacteria bacterium]
MAIINFARREIIARVVYCGARGAGTTASVRKLYVDHTPDPSGGMLPFAPRGASEHSQVFEYHPADIEIPGFRFKVRLYSLPGALIHAGHRAEVLRDVDGIVFVANARPNEAEPNLDALLNLDRHLKKAGQDLANLPVVFQINHTDAADALSLDDVAFDLNPYRHPVILGSPVSGEGLAAVRDAVVKRIAALLADNLEGKPTCLQVHAIHRRESASIEQVVEAHQRAVRLAEAQATPAPAPRAAPWSRSGYDVLPLEHTVSLNYHPPSLAGMSPLQVLGARVHELTVVVDLIMADPEGNNPTRLHVHLVPEGDSPTPSSAARAPLPTLETDPMPTDSATLPMPIEDTWRLASYAVIGTISGIIVGLLTGFLIWA